MNKKVQVVISGFYNIQDLADIQARLKGTGYFNSKPFLTGKADCGKANIYRASYSIYDYSEYKRRLRLQVGIEKDVKVLTLWQKICKMFLGS